MSFTANQAWADAAIPASYAWRVQLQAVADASLQRLALPADALLRLQTSNHSDVRIFNAQGQSVPIALASVAAKTQSQKNQVQLTALPIMGGTVGSASEGLSLRIDERQGKRVVQLDTATSASNPSTNKKIIGALLDARAIQASAVAIALDVVLPVAQPIGFDVQASKDLKNWRPLADTVLYRAADPGAAPASLGTQQMKLAFSDIKDHYLRITWQGDASALADVVVRGATVTTSQNSGFNPRVSAFIGVPVLTNAHELSFGLPFATPLAGLKIKAAGPSVLIPVQVFGRNDNTQPWELLASTVLYNIAAQGKQQTNMAVELHGSSHREIKIEADKKTAGFSSAPEISADFEPVQVVFLATGSSPFTLAAGLDRASSAYLPLPSLIPGYQSGQEDGLPLAALVATGPAPTPSITAVSSPGNMPPTRNLILWGVLLAGVALLGMMAWMLMKQPKTSNATAPPA